MQVPEQLKGLSKVVLITATVAAGTVLAFSLGLTVFGRWHDQWSGYNSSFYVSDGWCNIAVVPVVGDLTSFDEGVLDDYDLANYEIASADRLVAKLKKAESDPYIRGIMLRIDSGGGGPTASEIVTTAVKSSSLPTAALIRELGASGAYLIATGADTIIASKFSEVGSIGIDMSYMDYSDKNAAEGINYVNLTSAAYKGMWNPDRPLTPAERDLIERDLGIYHQVFVDHVAANRNLPVEEVAKLADGSSMPGELALENKLIDALGDEATARQWFAEKLNLDITEVVLCQP